MAEIQRRTRSSWWLVAALALAALAPAHTAQAQDALERRATEAAISGMNLANHGGNIRYDGQPGQGTTLQGVLNEDSFEHLADYHFVLRDGARPSTAIRAAFAGPTRLECNTMMIAIEYRSILAALGPRRFDRAFDGGADARTLTIEIGRALAPHVLEGYLVELDVNDPEFELRVGDWVYFANHDDYLYKHPAGAWQGENALYVGDDADGNKLFSGFGVHSVTAEKMHEELLEAYNAPRSRSDEEASWRSLSDADKERMRWLGDNQMIVAADEDEALDKAYRGLNLDAQSEGNFDYDLIQDDPGNTIIAIIYTPSELDYEDEIEAEDVPGLIQCMRLDFDRLRELRALPANRPRRGLSGAIDGR
jgi:Protein-glutamine gamma-glutamyltransferase